MRLNFFLLLSVFAMISCDGNVDEEPKTFTPKGSTDINLVTGMEAQASEYDSPIILGNPNVFKSQMVFFPNPAINLLSIKSNYVITDIWFVKAKTDKKYKGTDFSKILSSDLYTESDISSSAELKISDISGNNTNINIENLSFGYYRVFVKADGALFWSNIYVGNDIDIDGLISFWN
ncbi:hypothetical protein WJN01_08060 [Flavobacteriaceae bacterium SZ-1-7]|uniref:hypothetical protein n=1 Tax=Tamlana sedimenti TaxID=3134126 RepID=UPI0031256F91